MRPSPGSRRYKMVVINLERSAERRAFMQHSLRAFPFEFFTAVEGRRITLHPIEYEPLKSVAEYEGRYFLVDYATKTDFHTRGALSTAQIGAVLSHLQLYARLLEDLEHDFYVIFEDDAMPMAAPAAIIEYLANTPEDFDVIHLNSQSRWYPLLPAGRVNDFYSRVAQRFFSCAASYAVSKRGAAKIIGQARQTVMRPPDDLLSHYNIGGQIEVLMPSEEFLFTRDDSFASTIDEPVAKPPGAGVPAE